MMSSIPGIYIQSTCEVKGRTFTGPRLSWSKFSRWWGRSPLSKRVGEYPSLTSYFQVWYTRHLAWIPAPP